MYYVHYMFYWQGVDRPSPQRLERERPYNLFFALLPEPKIVSQVSELGATVCGAHRLRGKPIWPDRLHITLLSAVIRQCGLVENATTAKRAATRVNAPAFDLALDITESYYVAAGGHPFVLSSGDGLEAVKALRWSIVGAMAEEGFRMRVPRDDDAHMTLMWADRRVGEYPILPICWKVREFALVLSYVGESRHEHLAKWRLRS